MTPSSPKYRAKPITVDWRAVGQRIRELRGFYMTQQEFAKRVGISQNYVSDMERGTVEVGAEILLTVACEFGRTIEWLLTGEDRPGPLGKK
jgi:transcriptional regulator with XRE-family HTH domain